MALDAPNFLLKDLVPEPRLEFTLPKRCCSHGHGILTSSHQDLYTWKYEIGEIRRERVIGRGRTYGFNGAIAALLSGVSVS